MVKFGPKNQNCQVMLEFGTYTNSSMHNLMMAFPFSVFNWKYPFGTNLVHKLS